MRELGPDFGTALRAQRERQGLTVEDVAASTKSNTTLLSALERSDLTRWPKGIYGRAFLRAYADAIGFPADSLDGVLQQLRTPEEASAAGDAEAPSADAPAMRLTLDTEAVSVRHPIAHAVDAALTLLGVLTVAAIIGTAAEVSFLNAAAVVALVWYPIAHAAFGGFSPTRLLIKDRRAVLQYQPDEPAGRQAFADYQVTN